MDTTISSSNALIKHVRGNMWFVDLLGLFIGSLSRAVVPLPRTNSNTPQVELSEAPVLWLCVYI